MAPVGVIPETQTDLLPPIAPHRRIGGEMQSIRLIRIRELATTRNRPGLIPASPATIWRWVKAGTFPAPIKLSDRVTAWETQAVAAWIDARAASA